MIFVGTTAQTLGGDTRRGPSGSVAALAGGEDSDESSPLFESSIPSVDGCCRDLFMFMVHLVERREWNRPGDKTEIMAPFTCSHSFRRAVCCGLLALRQKIKRHHHVPKRMTTHSSFYKSFQSFKMGYFLSERGIILLAIMGQKLMINTQE